MAHSDSPLQFQTDSQLPTEQAASISLGEALDLQRPAAAAAAPLKVSPRASPPSAEYEALIGRNRANLLGELRAIAHAHLVTVDAEDKKSRLEATIRNKRRRRDSDGAAAAAGPDSSSAMDHDDDEATHVLGEESIVDGMDGEDDDDDDESDVVTVVTISTPIHTPARSPAPPRRTPPTITTTVGARAAAAAAVSVDVVVPPMTAQEEADLQVLRAQGLVTAALRERTAMHASAPASQGRDADILQTLRQTRRVTGLLGQQAFVRTLEASLQNRPASGAMRTPLRRRAPSALVAEQPAPLHQQQQREGERGQRVVPPTDPRLNAEIENEIVLLTRAAPVTRMLQSEQRQVLEILIRHRIERQGRPPARANPAGVLLRQAHRLREQPGQQEHRMEENAHAAPPAAGGQSAGANAITISVLQAQIRIMTEQMAEMARMVTATYQLQQEMQRTMNQQVAAVFHTFTAQAEFAQQQQQQQAQAAHAHAPPMASLFTPHAPAAAAAAAAASVGGSASGAPGVSLGNCVICTQQVDSVLYRCGHMCVCGLCARQLKAQDQWCPMCRAPIDDIVRVYPN